MNHKDKHLYGRLFSCLNILFIWLYIQFFGHETSRITLVIWFGICYIIVKKFGWRMMFSSLGSVCAAILILRFIAVTDLTIYVSLFIIILINAFRMFFLHKSNVRRKNADKKLEIENHYKYKDKEDDK